MEENGQLVKFLYNENREAVAEEESDGNVIRYIRRLGLISSDSEKAKTYYHYVSDEQGSITHVINGEEKESGELPQEDVQSRVLNHYEYDAFGNTIRCEEQVHNRFRYTGEQYDPLTGQYYLRARYYNPVSARFTQEDTYYGDGLNIYTYCRNNLILNHDPTGHGTKENSPYSRKEQQYIDAGADPDTAKLATQCYPDAKSKQDLYNKYKSQGYNATDAKKLANYEIVHGEERAKNYAANNVKKSGPDYTPTSPRDNVNTDWRTQNRLNAQKKAGAGKTRVVNILFSHMKMLKTSLLMPYMVRIMRMQSYWENMGMVVRRHIQALPKIWMRNISNLIIGMSLQLVILMMRFGKLMKSFWISRQVLGEKYTYRIIQKNI